MVGSHKGKPVKFCFYTCIQKSKILFSLGGFFFAVKKNQKHDIHFYMWFVKRVARENQF